MKKIRILVLIAAAFVAEAKPLQKEINGIVTSKGNGDVLDLVVVWVKGTNQGMVTGEDGYFDLLVNEGDTLEFSGRGYKTTQLVVGGKSLYKAELEKEETATNNRLRVSAIDARINAKQD